MPAAVALVAVAAAGAAGTAAVGGFFIGGITFGLAAGMAASVIGGIVIGAVVGGITAAIMGGDILKGALAGGLVGGVAGGIAGFSAASADAGLVAEADALSMASEPGMVAETGASADVFSVNIVTGNTTPIETMKITGNNVLATGDGKILTTSLNKGMVPSTGVAPTGTELLGAAQGTDLGAQMLAQTARSNMIGNVVQGVATGGAGLLQSKDAEELADTVYERNKKKVQEDVELPSGGFVLDKEAYADSQVESEASASAAVKPYLTARPQYVSQVPEELLNKA